MILGLSYYEIAWYFLIYSFFGWVMEVAYAALTKGKVVNRGFLNGPVCPVYGFGMLGILALVKNLDNLDLTGQTITDVWEPLQLFFYGMIICSVIEYIAGWALDKIYHARWWDYSNVPFNINGYICLKFSVLWGIGVVIAVKIVHPLTARASVSFIPENIGWWILLVLYLIYLADLLVTVLIMKGVSRRLDELETIREKMRIPSNTLSTKIGENTIETADRIEGARVQASLARAEVKDELESRKEKLENEILKAKFFGMRRIMDAFPDMYVREHLEEFKELRRKVLEEAEAEK